MQRNYERIFSLIRDTSSSKASCSRRTMLGKSGNGLAALSIASLSIGLMSGVSRASAQASADTAGLTLVLKLKLLTQQFYATALASASLTALFTADESAAIAEILTQETAHATLLASLVSASAPSGGYDFTAGGGTHTGPYSPFTNKADFFRVACYLEDLSVRTYIGVLEGLVGGMHVTTICQIQSIEARHAAQIRRLASNTSTNPYMPTAWDTTPGNIENAVYGPGTTTFSPSGFPNASTGEDNQIARTSYSTAGVNTNAAAAFDEPLSTANVLVAAAFFGVS